jgi:hypothetical protein
MRHLLAWSLCAAIGLALASQLAAAPPEEGIRVARLVKQLGSDSYASRTEATTALEKLGPAARQQLESAAQDPEPEVRLRAKELLSRLKIVELWAATEMACPAEAAPASKRLAELAAATGNRVLLGDQYGSFHEQPVTLAAGNRPFWEVVDEVCRTSGNRARPHFDLREPGLVVVAGEPGKHPVALAGPIRAQITSARRAFNEELNYETLGSEVNHSFQIGLQVMWEDRFRLVAYRAQPELVAAITPGGDKLPVTVSSGGTWNVAGPATRQVTTTLRLHPPPTSASELDSLILHWGVIAVGDMAKIEMTDLKPNQPAFQDDVELSVESIETHGGAHYELALRVTRELVVPEPSDVIFQENEIEVFDADGKPFRKQGQSNSLGEDGAKIKLDLIGETSESVPTRLEFRYPRIRSQRDVELVFRHVPLPVSRPQ